MATYVNGIETDSGLRYHLFNKVRTGAWLASPLTAALPATNDAIGNGLLVMVPYPIARPVTVSGIGVSVTGAQADSTIRLGIYADGTNLYPGALVKDAGTVASTANAFTSIDLTSTPVSLQPALYWVVALGDTAALGIAKGTSFIPIIGFASSMLWIGSYYVAQAAGALPATCTAGGSENGTTYGIYLRFASLD